MEKMTKVLSHTDLDGVGSAIIIARLSAGTTQMEYGDYPNIDKRVNNFLDKADLSLYSNLFITDISVNEETAERLEAIHQSNPDLTIQLLDHHKTAKWLNKYDWAYVSTAHIKNTKTMETYPSSGTSLVVNHFEHELNIFIPKVVREFAEQVRRYDTWEWSDVYKEIRPKELNDLLYTIGREQFSATYSRFLEKSDTPFFDWFTIEHRTLLDQRQKEIEAYIKKKDEQLTVTDGNVGIVFAESHVSELGNEICKLHPEIDYVVIFDVGARKMSFRTVKDIDLSEIAKSHGGGGHPKASGASFELSELLTVIESF